MRRIIFLVTAAALFAAATKAVLPRAVESFALLYAQDDPAMLADIAVTKSLSVPRAQT